MSSKNETDSSTDEIDNDHDECRNMLQQRKKKKNIDWVQWDACNHSFHEFCISSDKSSDLFSCADCFEWKKC